MDGTTEPIIAVMGHPIAGNPSQFALERALESMKLDWRVLSLDVPPDQIAKAISGAWVMGFHGLMLDPSTSNSAKQLRPEPVQNEPMPEMDEPRPEKTDSQSNLAPPTCFFRDSEVSDGYQSENSQSCWLADVIQSHFRSVEKSIGPVLWVGDRDERFPHQMVEIDTQSPIAWAAQESIENSNLIVLTEPVDVSQWPSNDGGTLVIDMSINCSPDADEDAVDVTSLRELGYVLISADELQAGELSQCLVRWTGRRPPVEVLREAIEEYLAV